MVSVLSAIVGGYLIAETYKILTTPSEKRSWENYVKMHHGEAGILMALAGVATKSPAMIGSGIGLTLHDRKDASKWFGGILRGINK